MLYLDTSFIVPYFTREAASAKVEKFLLGHKAGELAISWWTRVEFASAISIKLRTNQLTMDLAEQTLSTFRAIADDYFITLPSSERDFAAAEEFLAEWDLGLRSGDALHLAIARNNKVRCLYSLDKKMIASAKALHIPASTGIKIS